MLGSAGSEALGCRPSDQHRSGLQAPFGVATCKQGQTSPNNTGLTAEADREGLRRLRLGIAFLLLIMLSQHTGYFSNWLTNLDIYWIIELTGKKHYSLNMGCKLTPLPDSNSKHPALYQCKQQHLGNLG